MRLKLNQSIPWSEEETGGFAISAVLSSAVFWLVLRLVEEPTAGTMLNPHVPIGSPAYKIRIPDPSYVPPFAMALMALLAIFLLNASPVKRLPGLLQYLICCVAGGFIGHRGSPESGVVLSIIVAPVLGLVIFAVYRVNWWAWWDYPSRRTIGQRMLASIFFTGIPVLGVGFGVWRLVFGIGLHDVTTQFVADPAAPNAKPLETIIEDPALADHARRIDAIRSAQAGVGTGRKSSGDKGTVSESI